MSFFKTLKRGFKGAAKAVSADSYVINGMAVNCVHCGGKHFDEGQAQMNTAGLTFLNLDWANKSATVMVCKTCTHVMWFARSPEKVLD
ncbi:zinc ribbon domain-containing protein [Marinicella sp. S1101]|uniref:zinc ribbon domain-containing protein n=1 Tax=Marinicella marina TaxID=2996016 RepID=UPI002260EBD3|nr:zinc ribbon domain-containing protein [Marinicella marina]MCX7553625.1 zinc ribbon domain-containing protein [Marinicella marina]MDJ1140249.1 zinc ribbon domain-containing protein [Marinicella marina]